MHGAVATMRRFNRSYTRTLGLLNEKLLGSDFTLTEARVLYELASAGAPLSPGQLSRELVLDGGYLSRIIHNFGARGLLTRTTDPDDARQVRLSLTEAGRLAFAPLNAASEQAIAALLDTVSPADRPRLIHAMQTIQALLNGSPDVPIRFRDLQPGDIGWIAHRQMLIYAAEYGWSGEYEALAAEILAAFARTYDPVREKAWIAEREGHVVGSVFVMRTSDAVAKLRLLYVEPEARGLGLGRDLVEACIAFARDRGYRTLTLWTNDVLVPARRIYQATGFVCVKAEPHHSFGHDLAGETWELALES
jgi:DNA-binding MarR family transcriptional regulator/GNAT superfamily N-acetyltransferase